MDKSLIATSSIKIKSGPEKVWDVATNPEKIKIYLFGTDVETDWKVGSKVVFKGSYQGQKYTDKGKVIENTPYQQLKYSYLSSFSGLKDRPENYSIVTYTILPVGKGKTEFTWHQQGFSSEERKSHTKEMIKATLDKIKKLAEE